LARAALAAAACFDWGGCAILWNASSVRSNSSPDIRTVRMMILRIVAESSTIINDLPIRPP
jgi:hypothetical protein